ncbi:hypothetical protein [Streptomyces sp. NPDC050255]|uniref:hypothetical protein n=1 Tax=Streptomyces sp. NPDC050255 TaxID=3365606 RepID=UPI0037B2CCED
MAANWYLVKYVPDPFRDEPRNVGVVIDSGEGGILRFIGQTKDGFDGRKVRGVVRSSKTLRAWIEYIEYQLQSGTFAEHAELSISRSMNSYRIEKRGALLGGDLQGAADELFRDLVSDADGAHQATIDELANQLLFRKLRVPAGHKIEKDVRYQVDWNGEPRDLPFDYRYQNGKTTLLDKITLSTPDKTVSQRVNDLLFRIEHLQRDGRVQNPSFVTLYDMGKGARTGPVEGHLRAIEKMSHTFNLRNEETPGEVAQALGVPLLQDA